MTGHRRSETGHASDFIFCPMLLCHALDRQKFFLRFFKVFRNSFRPSQRAMILFWDFGAIL